MNNTWKAVLGVVLIYIFGCFSGIVSTSIFFHQKMLNFWHNPAVAVSAALEKRLTGNLALDANQKQQVHGYFMENLTQRKELQKEIQPRVETLNRQTVQQITAVLRPEQVELFNQNVDRLRKRFGATASNQDAADPSAPTAQAVVPAASPSVGRAPTP